MVNQRWIACLFMLLFLLGMGGSALAEMRFDEGRWRIELNGAAGIHSGPNDRKGDFLLTGAVEYEFPATQKCTLGLRLLPLFVYSQDRPDRDWDERFYDGATLWGGGVGIAGRLYTKENYQGLFFEIEANALAHDNKITGNSANVNFVTGAGIGYKFNDHWHAVMKYGHISNAGFGADNSGANIVGIGFGYTF